MSKNIGFISTRFAGTDGVTLESYKWATVLERMGHRCFWFAGELDTDPEKSFLVPEAHFVHDKNRIIDDAVFGHRGRASSITTLIHEQWEYLKNQLHEFINRFDLELLIAENVLTIPMHIPLGMALTETIAETQLPTIAHHHDFYWERVRFSINAVHDYISMAFPPVLPNIRHVVINSAALEELAHRRGLSSVVVPNVLEFENPPDPKNLGKVNLKKEIGLEDDDIIILQPTRIVRREGIEYAVDLVKALGNGRTKLVISHEAGDEGFEYPDWVREYALEHEVDLRLVRTRVTNPFSNKRGPDNDLTLWDIYPHADFITFPSLVEGFGNAFLEAIYFRKPILINRYANFVRDIEPLGFDLCIMDGFLTKKTVQHVEKTLASAEAAAQMTDTNYGIAARYYSYSVLKKHLTSIMVNFFGEEIPDHMQKVVGYFAKHEPG